MNDNYFKETSVVVNYYFSKFSPEGSGPRTSIATSCYGPEGGSTRCIGSGAQNSPTT